MSVCLDSALLLRRRCKQKGHGDMERSGTVHFRAKSPPPQSCFCGQSSGTANSGMPPRLHDNGTGLLAMVTLSAYTLREAEIHIWGMWISHIEIDIHFALPWVGHKQPRRKSSLLREIFSSVDISSRPPKLWHTWARKRHRVCASSLANQMSLSLVYVSVCSKSKGLTQFSDTLKVL